MAFDPDSYLATKEQPPAPAFDPDRYLATKAAPEAPQSQAFDPDAYVAKKTAEIASQPGFDPVAHAEETGDDATGYAAWKAKDAEPWHPETWAGRAAAAVPGAVVAGVKGLWNFGRAGVEGTYDALAAPFRTAQENQTARAETELALQAGGEAVSHIGHLAEKHITTPLYEKLVGLTPEQKETGLRNRWESEKQAYRNQKDIAAGKPLQTGILASATQAITGKPIAEDIGPEALAAAGAQPVDPARVERRAMLVDPVNLALMLQPEFSFFGKIGGAATQGVGKVMKGAGAALDFVPGKIGKFSKALGANATAGEIAAAAAAAAVNPHVAAAGVAAGMLGRTLKWAGEGLDVSGRALRTGAHSAADMAAQAAYTAGTRLPFMQAAQRTLGNLTAHGAQIIATFTPVNLFLSEGDPEKFVHMEVGAGIMGAGFHLPRELVFRRAAMQRIAQARMAQDGTQQFTTDPLFAAHQQAVQTFSPDAQQAIARARSNAFRGFGSDILVLDGANYVAKVGDIGGDTRGHFHQEGNTIYLNADAISAAEKASGRPLTPGERGTKAAQTAGHEVGHAIVKFLNDAGREADAHGLFDAIAKGMTPEQLATLMTEYRGALSKGTPAKEQAGLGWKRPETPDVRAGIDAKIAKANTPEKIIEENLAEITREILNGNDVSHFMLPQPLMERITDSAARWMENRKQPWIAKIDPRADLAFKAQMVREAARQMKAILYEGGKRSSASIAEGPTASMEIARLQREHAAIPPFNDNGSAKTEQDNARKRAKIERDLNLWQRRAAGETVPEDAAPEGQPAEGQPAAPAPGSPQAAAQMRQAVAEQMKAEGIRNPHPQINEALKRNPALASPEDLLAYVKAIEAEQQAIKEAKIILTSQAKGEINYTATEVIRAINDIIEAHKEPITDPIKLANAVRKVKVDPNWKPKEGELNQPDKPKAPTGLRPFNDHLGNNLTVAGALERPAQEGDFIFTKDGQLLRVVRVIDGAVETTFTTTANPTTTYRIKDGTYTVLETTAAPKAAPSSPAQESKPKPAAPAQAATPAPAAGEPTPEPGIPGIDPAPGAGTPAPEVPELRAIPYVTKEGKVADRWVVVDRADNPISDTLTTAEKQAVNAAIPGTFKITPQEAAQARITPHEEPASESPTGEPVPPRTGTAVAESPAADDPARPPAVRQLSVKDIDDAHQEGEMAARLDPDNQRKKGGGLTAAGEKKVAAAGVKAAAKAHAETVPPNYAGITERTDPIDPTAKTIEGNIRAGRPFDDYLIKLAGLSSKAKSWISHIADRLGQPLAVRYLHAEGEGWVEGTEGGINNAATRRARQGHKTTDERAARAEAVSQDPDKGQIETKVIVPDGFKFNPGKRSITITGRNPEKMRANFGRAEKEVRALGERVPYEGENDPQIDADIAGLEANNSNGHTWDGRPLDDLGTGLVPRPVAGYRPYRGFFDANGKPDVHRFEFLNLIMGDESARLGAEGMTDAKEAKLALAIKNRGPEGARVNATTGETNSLRERINDKVGPVPAYTVAEDGKALIPDTYKRGERAGQPKTTRWSTAEMENALSESIRVDLIENILNEVPKGQVSPLHTHGRTEAVTPEGFGKLNLIAIAGRFMPEDASPQDHAKERIRARLTPYNAAQDARREKIDTASLNRSAEAVRVMRQDESGHYDIAAKIDGQWEPLAKDVPHDRLADYIGARAADVPKGASLMTLNNPRFEKKVSQRTNATVTPIDETRKIREKSVRGMSGQPKARGQDVPESPRPILKGVEGDTQAESRTEKEIQRAAIRLGLSTEGKTTAETLRALRGREISDASPELRRAIESGVVVPEVSLETPPTGSVGSRGTTTKVLAREAGKSFMPEEDQPRLPMKVRPSLKRGTHTRQDELYVKALADGDEAAAHRIVERAAKQAGYVAGDLKHGTEEEFTSFEQSGTTTHDGDQVFYVTPDGNYAKVYAGEKGRVMRLILNPGKTFDTTKPAHRKMLVDSMKGDNFKKHEIDGYFDDFMDGLPHWENEDVLRFARRNGFDSVRVKERPTIESLAFFEPQRAKLSDTVTNDDEGHIIPPSQRFNMRSKDLRFMPEESPGTGKERQTPQEAARKRQFQQWSRGLPEVNSKEPLPRTGGFLRMFHGTPDASHDEFRPGTHFTESEEYADRYQHPSASSINVTEKKANNPGTYSVFVKTEKPFDTRNPQERRIYERDFLNKRGNGTPLSERGLPDWTDSRDMLEWFEAEGLPYDSIVLDEGGTPEGGWRGTAVVPVDGSQVKSTANRGTFDESRNIHFMPEDTGAPKTSKERAKERLTGAPGAQRPDPREAAAARQRASQHSVQLGDARMTPGAQEIRMPRFMPEPGYHGTPHEFEPEPGHPAGRFRKDKVGTGEGAAAYGHGVAYLAQNPDVAKSYLTAGQPTLQINRRADGTVGLNDPNNGNRLVKTFDTIEDARAFLDKRQKGNILTVHIKPDHDAFLDWDRPLSEQSERVKAAMKEIAAAIKPTGNKTFDPNEEFAHQIASAPHRMTGDEAYRMISRLMEGGKKREEIGAKAASEKLASLGIAGIRYLDQGSRPVIDEIRRLELMQKHAPLDPVGASHLAELKARGGTSNFVIFNENDIEITHKNGEPVTPAERKETMGQPADEKRFMPEDYAMQHRPNDEGPRAFDLLENDLAPRDIYEHPDYYTGQPGTLAHRQTVAALRAIKGKPDAEVTIYRASPKAEINNGDWVSLSRIYAKQHGMADDPRADVLVHAHKVKAKDLRWPGDELGEFGYYPERAEAMQPRALPDAEPLPTADDTVAEAYKAHQSAAKALREAQEAGTTGPKLAAAKRIAGNAKEAMEEAERKFFIDKSHPAPGGRQFMPSDHPDASDAILRKNDNWMQTAFLAMRTLARKQAIGTIGNDETNPKSLEEMKEWRYDHPDAKAAAKAYPLPLGFLNSVEFTEGVGHSDNLFASLAAFESRSGRKASSRDFEGFRAAAAPLVAEARRTDRVFDKRILALVGAEGGESKVIFTPGRVLKISQDSESAGAVVRFLENGKPTVERGTLPEFIRQIETDNRLLDLDIRTEGIMDTGDGTRLVTSQKAIHGVPPTYAEAEKAFRADGFFPIKQEWMLGQEGHEMWWSPELNIAFMDAKPDNLVKTDSGDIAPIDIKTFEPTGKALEWMEAHVNREPPKIDHKSRALERQRERAERALAKYRRPAAFMPEPDAPNRAAATGQPRPDVRAAAKARIVARTPQDDRKKLELLVR